MQPVPNGLLQFSLPLDEAAGYVPLQSRAFCDLVCQKVILECYKIKGKKEKREANKKREKGNEERITDIRSDWSQFSRFEETKFEDAANTIHQPNIPTHNLQNLKQFCVHYSVLPHDNYCTPRCTSRSATQTVEYKSNFAHPEQIRLIYSSI